MAKKQEKTNVMRILDQKKIEYSHYAYDNTKLNAEEVANALNQEVGKVFKTLVTVGKSKEHYVFVVPANKELDLKKSCQSCKRKVNRDDSPKRTFATNRIYPWWLFTNRYEKAV